nr:gamma-glutamyltransferase [uncultured Gimesia sp.]
MNKSVESRAQDERGGGYDRPYGQPKQSRSAAVARHGMVATSQPLAAQVGLDILKSGGNAVDAAIAVNAMLGVVEPMSCGIGGDLFAIYWDAKSQQMFGLNASGRSPHNLTRDVFAKQQLKSIPFDGLLSWSIPGCVSGWDTLNKRFGTKSLAELLTPSIQTAEAGFPVTEIIAGYWKDAAEKLTRWPDSAETFLIDGLRAPREAELFHNPRLAHTYQLIAEKGSQEFYEGSIAERIVNFSQQHGGHFSLQDLADHRDDWIDPVSTNYRGYDVWELPPSGQGIAALEILNLLEQFDLESMGAGSAAFWHLFVEAKKLAYADRAKFYADPDFENVPVKELISKAYANRQRQRINLNQAAANVPAGDPILQNGDTVYLSVVDKDRNCCSLIQSNFHGFGSYVTPGDLGFVMQNRGALFALEESHLNRLEPHKRPFHTIIPVMVTHNNQPWFCFGVMGGDMQPQGHVQVLVNLIDFKMNVQAAGDAARVRHLGDATPTGEPAQGVGTVAVESGVSDQVVKELEQKGHHVIRSMGEFGGYQGIMIDREAGTLKGATESRKDGLAIGY